MLFEITQDKKGLKRKGALFKSHIAMGEERVIQQVEICPEVLEVLNLHRQSQRQNEAGGILMGSRYPNSLRVEMVTEPGPHDRSGPTFFERDATCAQRAINAAWLNSNGTQIYLGEWHTHPEPHPTPSSQDRKMIATMYEDAQPRHGPLLLLIVGTKSLWLGCQGQRLHVYENKS
jgi:integrative and conjugative element protein (TIGR02256 family)